MAGVEDFAFSRGDVIRRLNDLERALAEMRGERRAGSVSIYPQNPNADAIVRKMDPANARVDMTRFIFGWETDVVETQQGTTSTTWTDLSVVGPSVTVDVGPTGMVMCWFASQIGWAIAAPGAVGGSAAIDISGANLLTLSGSAETNRQVRAQTEAGGATTNTGIFGVGSFKTFTRLNPGPTTFKLMYKSRYGQNIDFDNRVISVIPI